MSSKSSRSASNLIRNMVPLKFSNTGEFKECLGFSITSTPTKKSHLWLEALIDNIRAEFSEFVPFVKFLPKESFHMTILDLKCGMANRKRRDRALDKASVKLGSHNLLPDKVRFRMVPTEMSPHDDAGIGIHFRPSTEQDAISLHRWIHQSGSAISEMFPE